VVLASNRKPDPGGPTAFMKAVARKLWTSLLAPYIFRCVFYIRQINIQFKSFVEQFESEARLREWLQPLEHILRDCRLPRARQRVLQYRVVVQALIDTLDPGHLTTRPRPAYPNKLSEQAKRDLVGRVFGAWLGSRFPNSQLVCQP
jgi:hypothetical protein